MTITIESLSPELVVEVMLDGRRVKVLRDFYCVVSIDGVYRHIIVPTGFISNLASVPRVLWAWIPQSGRYSYAAVVHDWLYHQRGWINDYLPDLTRKEADKIFLELMKFYQVGFVRRKLMYAAVRVGGSWD